DDFFSDHLSGDYDPDTGILLHYLPGEVVRNPAQDPLLSVVFRPHKMAPDKIIAECSAFLKKVTLKADSE
ncbi:MAG: hypothetical protein WCP34_16815, partial [Pseudomonadota bacterium]